MPCTLCWAQNGCEFTLYSSGSAQSDILPVLTWYGKIGVDMSTTSRTWSLDHYTSFIESLSSCLLELQGVQQLRYVFNACLPVKHLNILNAVQRL